MVEVYSQKQYELYIIVSDVPNLCYSLISLVYINFRLSIKNVEILSIMTAQ